MIEWILIAIGVVLMLIRLDHYKEVSIYWVICEMLSAIFVTIALYFVIFAIPTAFVSNTLITSGSTVITANTAGSISTSPPLNSYAPVLIYMFVVVWDLFCIVFMITDIPNIFFRKSLPKMPKMER